jgi:hypothetical protein
MLSVDAQFRRVVGRLGWAARRYFLEDRKQRVGVARVGGRLFALATYEAHEGDGKVQAGI